MNYCDKCGGPLRSSTDYYGDPQNQCRLCDLDHMARRAVEEGRRLWRLSASVHTMSDRERREFQEDVNWWNGIDPIRRRL